MSRSYRQSPPIRLMRALHRAMRYIDEEDRRQAGRFDLKISEFDVVATLGNTQGMRMCDLAGKMLTSAPNITRIVKRLEERGLVTREKSSVSDREVIARLTEPGVALFEECYPAAYRNFRDLFDSKLNARQQQELAELLERIPDEDKPE